MKLQIRSFKRANESLQASSRQFMVSNKEVINRWEGDYEELLDKMNQLTASRAQEEKIQKAEEVKETN